MPPPYPAELRRRAIELARRRAKPMSEVANDALRELAAKYLTAAGMVAMSISAARALASYITALPRPVTTTTGASIGGETALGTAERIVVVCEGLYRAHN